MPTSARRWLRDAGCACRAALTPVKNVGTVYVTGPGASISGGFTGIGTLYYLPAAAPLSVGGTFQVGTVIQL